MVRVGEVHQSEVRIISFFSNAFSCLKLITDGKTDEESSYGIQNAGIYAVSAALRENV